ncbi:MAG: Uma2 family endonuclease [Chloroflexota bacterium]|nr:Uma2 family endonuclease [Chloroflexota bacterium]
MEQVANLILDALIKTVVTKAELNRLDAEERHVEVEDGVIIDSDWGTTWIHLLIIRTLFRILDAHVVAHKLGEVFMDGGRYRLRGDETDVHRAYIPDLSFVRAARLPQNFDWRSSDLPLTPDLAVEVISPAQSNKKLLQRIAYYLESDAEEAWAVYPNREELHQYRDNDDGVRVYRGDDLIDTRRLFPGLELKVSMLFVTPS